MGDKRGERKAKQARRDVRRSKKRDLKNRAEPTLVEIVRRAIARGHPAYLLDLASRAIRAARRDATRLDNILTNLIAMPDPEMTALLTVIAELLVDDPAQQARCRRELSERCKYLTHSITAPQVTPHRAVRRTHVLGDVDELVIGARLDTYEVTVAVRIDHNKLSSVVDSAVSAEPIVNVLARVGKTSTDTDVVEMNLADARAWIEQALTMSTFLPETETWPLYRPLVQWFVMQLPEGGAHRSPTDWAAAEEVRDKFFATDLAAPFTDPGHRELLLELFETGSGDPLRWSEIRIERAIGRPCYDDTYIPLEIVLDAPDLLRAFIPYAHAQSGIRDELTGRTIAMIDRLRSRYKREILGQAERWDLDHAG